MTSRGSNLQRPLCTVLSLNIAQILAACVFNHLTGAGGRDDALTGEMAQHIPQCRSPNHGGIADPGGLCTRCLRTQQSPPLARGRHCRRQGTGNRHQAAIQRQLTKCDAL